MDINTTQKTPEENNTINVLKIIDSFGLNFNLGNVVYLLLNYTFVSQKNDALSSHAGTYHTITFPLLLQ